MKNYGTGRFDDMSVAIDKIAQMADISVDYPTGDPAPQADIDPSWFAESYKGSSSASEFNAIQLYLADIELDKDMQDLFAGIAKCEMTHYDKLQGLIKSLGGSLIVDYSNAQLNDNIRNSKDIQSALRLAIDGEEATNKVYYEVRDRVQGATDTDTKSYILALLDKLIADEKVHIKLYNDALYKVIASNLAQNGTV